MLSFDEIWPRFEYVIEDMREGMFCFDGYIPSIGQGDLKPKISELIDRSRSYNLKNPVWADDSSESDMEKEYSPDEYVELYRSGKLVLLSFEYEQEINGLVLDLRLMVEESYGDTSLDIVCYREPILGSDDPKSAVETAISEFRYLRRLFQGDSLFIGPDCSSCPKNKDDNAEFWLRIE